MSHTQDTLNCLKNLMQIMCCDGSIDRDEKKFLSRAAKQLNVQVTDWNALLKEVLKDGSPIYPVQDPDKAVATLKAMIVMAKADTVIDEVEKKFVQDFAKSLGITNQQWKHILKDINVENLFEPFQPATGIIVVVKDDFDKIDAFLRVAQENGLTHQLTELQQHIQTGAPNEALTCFHAHPDKDTTVTRCRMLLDKAAGRTIAILNRFQGHQVKYLHEVGLKKCIIEPVYSHDITNILKSS